MVNKKNGEKIVSWMKKLRRKEKEEKMRRIETWKEKRRKRCANCVGGMLTHRNCRKGRA